MIDGGSRASKLRNHELMQMHSEHAALPDTLLAYDALAQTDLDLVYEPTFSLAQT